MPRCRLGLPDRLAAGAVRRASNWPRRLGYRPPHLPASCAGFAASAFARSCLTARSRSRRAGQSLRSGSPSRLAEKVQIVVGQYWWPWANVVVEPQDRQARLRADLRHARLRLARARMRSKALCSTPIWPRRRWRRPSPSSLLSMCRARSDRRYWRRLWRAARRPARRPSADRQRCCSTGRTSSRAAKPFLQLLDVRQAREVRGRRFLHRDPGARRSLSAEGRAPAMGRRRGAHPSFANCRDAMPEGAKLAIIERLLPERAVDDPAAIMIDLHMMTITGGRARSLADFEHAPVRSRAHAWRR